MTNPSLFDCYKAARNGGREKPAEAVRRARDAFQRGRLPYVYKRPDHIGHGDVIRWRDASGKRTAVVAIVTDADYGPPWQEEDGHGPVTGWTTRAKEPGEMVLNSDRGSKRFYDFQEACRIARRDGWNAAPYNVPGETKKQRAARAAMADFERMAGWCNDNWNYVGVCLFELPRDGVQRAAARVADSGPFGTLKHAALWGIESDSPEYHATVAWELISELV